MNLRRRTIVSLAAVGLVPAMAPASADTGAQPASPPVARAADAAAIVAAHCPGKIDQACLEQLFASARSALESGRDSEAYAEAALAVATRLHGEKGLDTGWAHRALGDSFLEQSRPADAERHFRRSLAILENGMDARDPFIAGAHNAVGRSLMAARRPDAAEPFFRKALEIMIAGRGPDDPETGVIHSNLGMALALQGNSAAGEPHLKRAHEIGSRSGGPGPSEPLARAKHELGRILFWQGRFAEAEGLLKESVAMYAALRGSLDSVPAGIHRVLGELFLELGRPMEAEQALRRSLRGAGSEEPRQWGSAAETYIHLASALELQGRAADGEIYVRQAIDALGRREDADAAGALLALAINLLIQNRLPEAERLTRRAAEIFLELGGPRDDRSARAFRTLGLVQDAMGRREEARASFARALVGWRGDLGDVSAAASLDAIGTSLAAEGRLDEGEAFLRTALAIREARLPPAHFAVLLQKLRLARHWRGAGALPRHRYAYYEASLEALVSARGSDPGAAIRDDIRKELQGDYLAQVEAAWQAANGR